MPATYKNFDREPSKPHQCMHNSEKDGHRCRATAMHNEYMCYSHRDDDIPTVIQNDPFLIERLATRAEIQEAVTQVAARLACNHMDMKRAGLLLQSLQIAMLNIAGYERLIGLPPIPPLAIPASSQSFAPDAETALELNPEPNPATDQTSSDNDVTASVDEAALDPNQSIVLNAAAEPSAQTPPPPTKSDPLTPTQAPSQSTRNPKVKTPSKSTPPARTHRTKPAQSTACHARKRCRSTGPTFLPSASRSARSQSLRQLRPPAPANRDLHR